MRRLPRPAACEVRRPAGLPTLPPMSADPSVPPQPPEPPQAPGAGLNRLQRAYFRWAEPHYLRLPPESRADARRMDEFLYSRRGLFLWLGWLSAVGASAAGLVQSGVPWALALVCSLVVWSGILIALASAWLMPDKFTGTRLWRGGLVAVLMGFCGLLTGFVVGRVARAGFQGWDSLAERMVQAARQATPVLLIGVFAMFALLWGVAQIRRQQAQSQLKQARAAQAQDALARQMAEARLKLLQAQIQPHFIFNTLAALQHWVDSGDERAGPLLRTLTKFLRGSTEMLGQAETTLAAEGETVGQYLAIMQARLGGRLRYELSLAPEAAAIRLPPGLLLTLVENAVEHGIAQSLSGGLVQVRAQRQGVRVQVSVADDGAGLAPDWVEGVGLANCRERLRHHGDGSGQLTLLARELGGTEALLDLPLEAA